MLGAPVHGEGPGVRAVNHNSLPAAALRDFFQAEASRRLRRAVAADQASVAETPAALEEVRASAAGALRAPAGMLARAAALLALLLLPWHALGEDTCETLVINGRTNSHVRVVSANPVEVVVMFDGGGATLKRTNLPPEFQAKYPYEEARAEAFRKEQLARAKARREQDRADFHAALLRQESDLTAKIARIETEIVATQKDIRAWQSKPRGTRGKGVDLDQLINRRLNLEHYRDELRRQQDGVRQQQRSYR